MADTIRNSQGASRADADRRSEGALARQTAIATAGGGLVTVKVDGRGGLRSLEIAPEAFDGRDPDLLADLIMSAITEAQRRVDENG